MALVAYGNSDSESGSDYDEPSVPTIAKPTPISAPATNVVVVASAAAAAGPSNKGAEPHRNASRAFSLPAPKGANNIADEDTDDDSEPETNNSHNGIAFNLPAPKMATASSHLRGGTSNPAANNIIIEEEDDEYLRKKPTAFPVERPPPPPKALPVRGPVKIVLPALATFVEHKQKEKPEIGAQLPSNRPTGLVDLLPKPKFGAFGQKPSTAAGKASTALVPDSIARPKKPTQLPKQPMTVAAAAAQRKSAAATAAASTSASAKADDDSDSDDNDNSDAEDFFSLQNDDDDALPEVSADEIAAMVARKTAQMQQVARQADLSAAAAAEEALAEAAARAADYQQAAHGASGAGGSAMDRQAMEALCGSRQAKRARHAFGGKAADEMSNIIEISGDQVLPDRDEWMRSQLTGTTEYQQRGLVDGDPGAGTKRKHQITYLAHQAKVNEQELQAMWSANRHAKRQTQNKYGF